MTDEKKMAVVEAIMKFKPEFSSFLKACRQVCDSFEPQSDKPCGDCPFLVEASGGFFCAILMARDTIINAIQVKLGDMYEAELKEAEQEKTEEG